VLIIYMALIRFMLQIHAGQGRLLFPALLPLALGLVYGLSRYRWPGVIVLAPALALVTSLYCLLFVIPPAYAQPPLITEVEIPAGSNRLEFDLGQGLELVAAQMETGESIPGEWVFLTLYWQAESVPGNAAEKEAPMYVLEMFGRENELIGKLQSYHGRGLFPASLWSPGDIVVDRIGVALSEGVEAPTQARLNIKLVGERESVEVGTVKVVPAEWPEAPAVFLAQMEGIQLVEASFDPKTAAPDDSVVVNLRWQVVDPPQRELTTFIHLGDPSQPPLVQGDSPPLAGHYPTQLWAAGEVFSDSYRLDLPADLVDGRYPIQVGLYDPETGLRLPLVFEGVRQPNDAYLVGWLDVEK
jgi:hypothetical protein